jgi:hypothetical protein
MLCVSEDMEGAMCVSFGGSEEAGLCVSFGEGEFAWLVGTAMACRRALLLRFKERFKPFRSQVGNGGQNG